MSSITWFLIDINIVIINIYNKISYLLINIWSIHVYDLLNDQFMYMMIYVFMVILFDNKLYNLIEI